MVKPKIIIVTQARVNSTRFPQKILKEINGETLLSIHLDRLKNSKIAQGVIVATTHEDKVEEIIKIAVAAGVGVYQGSTEDVLDRFYQSVKDELPDYVVRVTSDCPLIDPQLIDEVITLMIDSKVDYVANVIVESFPDGQDVEVFSFHALQTAWNKAVLTSDREHVTSFIRNNSNDNGQQLFTSKNLLSSKDYSSLRMTVDEPRDFTLIEKLVKDLGKTKTWIEYGNYIIENGLNDINDNIIRNEGYLKSLKANKMNNGTGQKLYEKAKTLIPGGTMLLSKRPEMFLPDNWPSYYSKAQGCKVWDLDGKEYIDMSIMGIGTNTLGYGNEEIDSVVMNVVRTGNMSTFNCPEEVYLAEKLVDLNPWASMVRFARTGGEANSIAIRIARAASGRDKVAICGYHGWHDWYLSANHNDSDSLSGHLIPGLDPTGVPKNLKDTVFPFQYNNFEELLHIVENNEIGVIKMEVVRNFGPENNFLQKVRDLATSRGIVLVFDECTSGFRETFGGIYQKFGVEPDIAMYGKTIGNGYALTAVVGRREVMEAAQKTFISSTFWTERIGPAAALKTLEVMEKMRSWEIITAQGKKMQDGWKQLADEHRLAISVSGIPALSTYSFNSSSALEYKTFITQEMLKKGFLASTNCYACTEHTDEYIDQYFNSLDGVYKVIAECEHEGRDITNLLEGPVCHSGFKRLN
ncbi:aminotransferase class III-fold pyridoxal phosphate-dependent enzyme [Dyadobacter fanqingshengii]|uniref:Aminotransferase class III-fold pyridoxal phosphate-dependent enzyme n=1 Tax=Dyadobacter fanqingshengii TaxID=2906443 RepID=A0A9X1P679_9BACT|nr:aminotransferase class III-fold pyridoxal phosphate-dependent enzyme [Dyadobacter fanqingshengii]MCF0039116.1 aminotransferase class III-fold pyridoxal phosphate-dependent enzyme [Dyadobacter fanqingshengii]USJ34064.1 aminotransferase class III-fold pyridoxal phosphate-dependent enzyme [Dyadobacter fanqingshengii]